MSGAAGADRSILVIKPSSLGDGVYAASRGPAQNARPDSRIAWLINTDWAPLIEGNPHVDEVIIFPRRRFRGLKGLPNVAIWANTMRKRRFDLVLDFQGLRRAPRAWGGGGPSGGGGFFWRAGGARFFYNRTVTVDPNQHAVERYLKLVADLGIDTRVPLGFPLPAGEKPHPFFVSGPYVLLHPFARGPGKSMPESDVRSLCRELLPIPVVVAGRSDKSLDLPRNCINMLNKTSLPALIWLIRNAHYVVSVDSGPMHIAAALGDNLLSIYRWSDPRLVGPYNPNAWVLKDGALFQMKNVHAPLEGMPPNVAEFPDIAGFVREKFAASTGR